MDSNNMSNNMNSNMNNNMNSNTDSNNMYSNNMYNNNMYNSTPSMGSPIIEENNRWKGVIGALLGALLGGLAWTAIGCLGYISGWIAALIFVLAQAGYKKMSGKEDFFGTVISAVFGLLVIIPATYASYAFNFFKAVNEGVNSHFNYFEVLRDMPVYMERYDLWGQFGMNLVKGYIFTIIIAVCMIAGNGKSKKNNVKKETDRKQNLK